VQGAARTATGAAGAFADLLAKAQAGEVSSHVPVTVANGAGVSLSDEQLRRLSIAADRAEASGVSRALVLIDGMALRLDVGVRQVTGRVELGPGAALAGVDGVVRAPEAAPAGTMEVPIAQAPGVSSMNATLLRALARAEGSPNDPNDPNEPR